MASLPWATAGNFDDLATIPSDRSQRRHGRSARFFGKQRENFARFDADFLAIERLQEMSYFLVEPLQRQLLRRNGNRFSRRPLRCLVRSADRTGRAQTDGSDMDCQIVNSAYYDFAYHKTGSVSVVAYRARRARIRS